MSAGPGLPLDLQDSLTALQAVLDVACGIPGGTSQALTGPFVFPQVGGDGVAVLPNGQAGTNELAGLTYEIISIVGVGWDEWRQSYDPNVAIPGDTYEPDPTDPTARLGGVIVTSCGNREITVQVKAELQAPNAAGGFKYIERVRSWLCLSSISDTLESKGLAIAEFRDARPVNYRDPLSGRTVSAVILEIIFNAADTTPDDPTTTIETAPATADPPLS